MEYGVKPLSVATCFVLVALLWTFPLQHIIAYPFVFLFFGAIMGSAWFGGAVAGFTAVVESSLIITYFFIPPLFSITVAKESQSFLARYVKKHLPAGVPQPTAPNFTDAVTGDRAGVAVLAISGRT